MVRPNCAKFPSFKCTHIFLWLKPTGHSKFHNTSNHPPPATDSGRTARTLLYRQCRRSLPPPFFSCPGQRNQRRPVPVPVTGVRYNSLLWMCTLNTLTWPDLTWPDSVFEERWLALVHVWFIVSSEQGEYCHDLRVLSRITCGIVNKVGRWNCQ